MLANDTDVDGDILQLQEGSVRIVSTEPGQNSVGVGSVEIDARGQIVYTPVADFFGTEVIEYKIDDGNGGLDSGTLTVNVLAVEEPPEISLRTGDTFDEDTGLILLTWLPRTSPMQMETRPQSWRSLPVVRGRYR